jgi:aryl-alcohol dehydrogenase-like predicted oxidoreductase
VKLAIGTVQFGLDYGIANTLGRVTNSEVAAVLTTARNCGMDTLDTAIAYGDSESVLGTMDLSSWKVVTKLPAIPEDPKKEVDQWVYDHVHESMRRLGVRQLYGLLLHRPDQLLGPFGSRLSAALETIKSDGLALKVGVSTYGPENIERILGRFSFDLLQIPLNVFDRRLVDSGWAHRLAQSGVELHARSIFLQGLLLMPPYARPSKFRRWDSIWNVWENWLLETRLSPLQACVQYALSIPEIERVVVGVDSVSQLQQIIKAVDGSLPELPRFPTLLDERLIHPPAWSNL